MSDPEKSHVRWFDPQSVTRVGILAVIAFGFYLAVYWQNREVSFENRHFFIRPENLSNLLGQAALVGILACAMTLVIELYDSVSNEILARAIDRRRTYNVGNVLRWTTRGTNRDAARRILRIWANLLVSRLDEIHGKPGG